MTPARLRITPHYAVSNESVSVSLTPFEGHMVLAMMGRPELSADLAAEILWPDPDKMPETWLIQIRTVMSRARAKLRPFGWRIASRYGFGWRLERHGSDSSRAAAQEAQRQAA